MDSSDALAIDEPTPLGFRVRCSVTYWDLIVSTKHPAMRDRIDDVRLTLARPDEVRRSLHDPDVMLFNRRVATRLVCAVVKKDGGVGYLITAYPADSIKRGDVIWTK